MKKMNLNQMKNLKSYLAMSTLVVLTLFASCEKNEESFTEHIITENEITGDYTNFNSTIINSDNGTPQGITTLKIFIGDELQISDDGIFKSSTSEGHWTKVGNTLFLYPEEGLPMNFEMQKTNDQTLELLQKYDSYDDYADGIIVYTFIRKGSNDNSLYENLLSSIEIWY